MKLEEHSPWFTSRCSTCALCHIQSSHEHHMCTMSTTCTADIPHYDEYSGRCHSLHITCMAYTVDHMVVCESMGLHGRVWSHITQVQQVSNYCHHVYTVQVISWSCGRTRRLVEPVTAYEPHSLPPV